MPEEKRKSWAGRISRQNDPPAGRHASGGYAGAGELLADLLVQLLVKLPLKKMLARSLARLPPQFAIEEAERSHGLGWAWGCPGWAPRGDGWRGSLTAMSGTLPGRRQWASPSIRGSIGFSAHAIPVCRVRTGRSELPFVRFERGTLVSASPLFLSMQIMGVRTATPVALVVASGGTGCDGCL